MSESNLHGPSRETLKRLRATMLGYMAQKDSGVSFSKGQVQQVLRPRKFCKICGATWDRKFTDPAEDTELEAENCVKCSKMLEDGFAAILSQKESQAIWIKLKDFGGQIVHVSPEVYSAAAARIKELERIKKQNNGGD